jgi:hypothetical protein
MQGAGDQGFGGAPFDPQQAMYGQQAQSYMTGPAAAPYSSAVPVDYQAYGAQSYYGPGAQ